MYCVILFKNIVSQPKSPCDNMGDKTNLINAFFKKVPTNARQQRHRSQAI